MKKATLTISFNAEKLGAVKQYMGKKDTKLQAELDEVIQKLYEKYVPAPVREYIESRDSEAGDNSSKLNRSAHPSSSPADDSN